MLQELLYTSYSHATERYYKTGYNNNQWSHVYESHGLSWVCILWLQPSAQSKN